MIIQLKSTLEVAKDIAKKAKAKRLSLNMSQKTLSKNSGVSLASLKKFEQTGQISLKSLLKIALILNELEPFDNLFKEDEKLPATLDELLMEKKSRKRGRK